MRRLLISIAFLALACGGSEAARLAEGEDPALALASPVQSRRYDVAFWVEQQHRRTHLWREAVVFCSGKDLASFPNCDSIRVVLFVESPPPFPRPGSAPRPQADSPDPSSPRPEVSR